MAYGMILMKSKKVCTTQVHAFGKFLLREYIDCIVFGLTRHYG